MFMIQTYSDAFFSVGAASRRDLIRLSRTVQHTYFIIYEFCFTCFKVEYKRTYIFQSSSNETLIIDTQIWTLIRKYAAYKLWFQKFERQLISLKAVSSEFLSTSFILSLTKFNRPFQLSEKHDKCLLLKSHYSY